MNEKYEDYINLILGFDDGKVGLCETNWLTPMKVRELNLTTPDCYIKMDYLTQEIEVLRSNYGNIDESNLYQTPLDIKKQNYAPRNSEPLKLELENFLECIIDKKVPKVSGLDGLRAVSIVEAGLESLRSNSVVELNL